MNRQAAELAALLCKPLRVVFIAALALSAPLFAAPAPARKLPELPRAPALELAAPSPDDLAEVDALLARVVAEDSAVRDVAVREILEVKPKLVTAVRRRLESLADSSNRNALKRLLFDVRREARDGARNEPEDADDKSDAPDYLHMLIARARSPRATWRDLTQVIALSRMLEHAGSVEAVRGLVEVYVRFGEFLRVDTQRALSRLGDRAAPALLEARRHQSERIGQWAARRLDALGRAAPGQAAQIADPQVLGDVLRAYGRTRDIDSARIVISFAGSERTQLREAARQAIALFGEVGHWQLRDAYESTVGKRPPRDWGWERTARELFAELDKLRRVEILDAFEAGRKAREQGDLEGMRKAFDQVLARAPSFEQADFMAKGYTDYARRHADDRRDEAILALRRADRLSSDAGARRPIQSLLFTLEAERHGERGLLDPTLFRRALELDPNNARARERLLSLSRGNADSDGRTRATIAAAIGLTGLFGVLVILLGPKVWSRRAGEPPADREAGA